MERYRLATRNLLIAFLVAVLVLVWVQMSQGQGVVILPNPAPTSTPVPWGAGRIDGMVLLQGRSDRSGAEVCAGDGGISVCEQTDTEGRYSIWVPEGSYLVTANMERYLDAEKLDVPVTGSIITTLPDVACLGGDTNDDCVVNVLDLALMGGRFGMSCGDPTWDSRADINNDCTVNILDLAMTGGNFGKTCPVPWSIDELPTPTPPSIPQATSTPGAYSGSG